MRIWYTYTHERCQRVAFYYFGENGERIFDTSRVLLLNGYRPPTSGYLIMCPHCGVITEILNTGFRPVIDDDLKQQIELARAQAQQSRWAVA